MALAVALLSTGISSLEAQDTRKEIDDKYVENDVVSLAGKKGISFLRKPAIFYLNRTRWCRQALATTGMATKGWKAITPRTWRIPVSPSRTPFLVLRARLSAGSLLTYR